MIHASCIFDGDVEVDDGVDIGPFTYIRGPCRIRSNTRIGSHCSIGGDPEHGSAVRNGRVEIGPDCIIREHVTIHSPVSGETRIGASVYLMNHSHVGHDATIEDECWIFPSCNVGGYARIQRGASLGMGTSVHQWVIVGPFAMTAMNAAANRDVPPLLTVGGSPARYLKPNQKKIAGLTYSFGSLWSYYQSARQVSPRKQSIDISEDEWLSLVSR